MSWIVLRGLALGLLASLVTQVVQAVAGGG